MSQYNIKTSNSPEQWVMLPDLIGMPTATTAVDGRTIHVGDIVTWNKGEVELVVKFQNNAISLVMDKPNAIGKNMKKNNPMRPVPRRGKI